jgi:hypothetical protein
MKILLFLLHFSGIVICLSAQSNKSENAVRELSFTDTNYIYIGIVNKFNLEKEKLGIVRITPSTAGISSNLYNTFFEIFPKHEGVFTVTLEAQKKRYSILFVAKKVSMQRS